MANTGSHDVHREQYPAPKPLGLDLIPMGVLPYDFCMLLCMYFVYHFILRSQAGGGMCICAGGFRGGVWVG